jgi:hypothetical protein
MHGMNSFKSIILILSLIFSGVFFMGTGLAKPESGVGTSQKWAVVNGFRSSQFGMNERDVIKAIKNDFGIAKNRFPGKFTRMKKPLHWE